MCVTPITMCLCTCSLFKIFFAFFTDMIMFASRHLNFLGHGNHGNCSLVMPKYFSWAGFDGGSIEVLIVFLKQKTCYQSSNIFNLKTPGGQSQTQNWIMRSWPKHAGWKYRFKSFLFLYNNFCNHIYWVEKSKHHWNRIKGWNKGFF